MLPIAVRLRGPLFLLSIQAVGRRARQASGAAVELRVREFMRRPGSGREVRRLASCGPSGFPGQGRSLALKRRARDG